jgi:hypothetical protein
MPRFDA